MCNGINSANDEVGDVGVPMMNNVNENAPTDETDVGASKNVVPYGPARSKRAKRAVKTSAADNHGTASSRKVGLRAKRTVVETRTETEAHEGPRVERTTQVRTEKETTVEFVGDFGGRRGVLRGSLSTIGWVLQKAGKITPWT